MLRAGGKDSTVLAHILTLLNRRHDYGLDLFLLSVDEGITGLPQQCFHAGFTGFISGRCIFL